MATSVRSRTEVSIHSVRSIVSHVYARVYVRTCVHPHYVIRECVHECPIPTMSAAIDEEMLVK